MGDFWNNMIQTLPQIFIAVPYSFNKVLRIIANKFSLNEFAS